MTRDTCLYAHYRASDGKMFYVGIGSAGRPYEYGRNQYWQNVVKKHGYRVEVLLEGLTWQEACAVEQIMISEFRSEAAAGVARLTNLTDGGEGTRGYKFTDEQKGRMMAALTPEWRRNLAGIGSKRFADRAWQRKHAEIVCDLAANPAWRGRHQVSVAHQHWKGAPFSSLNPQYYLWLYKRANGKVGVKPMTYQHNSRNF